MVYKSLLVTNQKKRLVLVMQIESKDTFKHRFSKISLGSEVMVQVHAIQIYARAIVCAHLMWLKMSSKFDSFIDFS